MNAFETRAAQPGSPLSLDGTSSGHSPAEPIRGWRHLSAGVMPEFDFPGHCLGQCQTPGGCMRTLLMTTAVALLIGGAAHAADETTGTTGMPGDQADLSQTFSGWDTNKDTYLTREERSEEHTS